MKSFVNNNSGIHSALIESKIKTVASIDQSRVSYFPQSQHAIQHLSEQQIYQWIKKLTSTSYLQTKSFSQKYNKFQSNFDYYNIKILKIDNVNLSQFFSNSKIQKMTNYKPYIQIIGNLVCQQSHNQTEIWKSQMIPLQFHKKNNKYQSEEQIDMYFYVKKKDKKVLKIYLNILLSDQIHTTQTIIQSRYYGYVLLDFFSCHQTIMLQIFQDLQDQNIFVQKTKALNYQQRLNKQNQIYHEHSTIKFKIIQSTEFKLFQNLLQPYQIYGVKYQIPGLKNIYLPTNNDKNYYNSIKFKKLENLNIQILDVTISQSQIRKCFQTYKQFSNLNINSQKGKEICFQNFQYSLKQYRLFFICHNGLTICDCSTIQLKQLKQKNKLKSSTKQRQKSQIKIEKKQVNKQMHLYTDELAKLSHFINDYGIVFIIQLMSKIQFKMANIKNKTKTFTLNIPIGFLIKSGDNLQNDLKYCEKLIEGQALNLKGIESWFKDKQKKQLKQSALMINQSQFISLSKIKQRAQSISQSTIQFYVYKETSSGNMPISKIMQKSQYLQKSNVSIIPNQSDLMYSQSFLPQNNDLKKIIMEKSRVIRQTQKLKQIIRKKNIEQNKTIPLLDPTQIKREIYQEKISKIRQQKQKVRQMHYFLKSKLEEIMQSTKKDDLIVDVLINLQDGPKVSKLSKQFVNAKSKVSFKKQTGDNKIKGEQLELFYPEPVQISSLLSEEKAYLILKVKQLINSCNSLQFFVLDVQIKNFQNKRINICSNYSDFKIINSEEIKLPFKMNDKSQQKNKHVKLTLKFQKISQNLLITILSSYITLYFFDVQTNLIVGQSFLNLKNLYFSLLNLNESQIENILIYNNIKIIGYFQCKFVRFIDNRQQLAKTNKQNTNSLFSQNKISIQNQQYRKLQRIKRFKDKQNRQSSEKQKTQNVKLSKDPIQESIKSKITINYHSLDSFFFQIQVQNIQNFAKTYTISINDQDKQFYDTQGQYDELIIVTNQKYRNQIISKSSFNWIKPSENGSFSLKQKEKGIILFSYLSDRKTFPFEFIQKIDPQMLSQYSSQLNIYNHSHTITLIISSQGEIQSMHQVKIQPEHDNNTIFYEHFVDAAKPLQLFFKVKSLQNIYFDSQFYDLSQGQQQLILKGNAVGLRELQIVNFMIYQPSYQMGKKICKSNKFNFFQQKVFNGISKQKFLNNYLILFGAQKLQLQCRLFETIDTIWTLKTNKIWSNSQDKMTKKEYLALSYDETKIGFRNKNGIIVNHKKIFINQKNEQYLLKLAAVSHQIGSSQTKLIFKNQKAKIIHRLIVQTKTQTPTISGTVQIIVEDSLKNDQVLIKTQISSNIFIGKSKQVIQSLKVQTTYPEIILWSGDITLKSQITMKNKEQQNKMNKQQQNKIIIGFIIKLNLLKTMIKGNNNVQTKKIIMGIIDGHNILYYEMVFKIKQSQLNMQFGYDILSNSHKIGNSLKGSKQKS